MLSQGISLAAMVKQCGLGVLPYSFEHILWHAHVREGPVASCQAWRDEAWSTAGTAKAVACESWLQKTAPASWHVKLRD